MSNKTSKIAPANESQHVPPNNATGFTTADKLLGFDSIFESEEVRKEVRTKLPIIDDNHKNSKTSKHSKSDKESQDSSKRVLKEVRKRSKNDAPPKTKQVRIKSPSSKRLERDKEIQDILKKYKRSTKRSNSDDSYLSIIALLKLGLRPSEIATESGVPKTTLQSHLNTLKKRGDIYKAGYGVWNVTVNTESTKKRSTKTIYVAKNTPPSEIRQNLHMFIPDSVRAHAFLFTLKVPSDLRNWTNEKREEYLDRRNIPYKSLGIIGGGQRLVIDGRKTHLTNKSIVIYDRSSYFAEKAIEAKSNAVHSFISIIKKLERTLHVELTFGSDYKFKVSRQHYALVKNALAQQYNSEGLKLEVRSEGDNSLWFLIDNSFNLDEAEGVHPKTGMTDTQRVQDMFNSIKDTGATMHTVLELNHGLQQLFAGLQQVQATSSVDQAAFAADLRTHVDVQKATATLQRDTTAVLKQVADGVQNLTVATKELTKAAKNGGGDP
jgi:hypothetical protein